MRVGIMTFHRAHNCGAALQAWALAQSIAARGHDCEIIDYRCAHIERITRRFFKSGGARRAWLSALFHLPRRTRQARRYRLFRERHMRVGARAIVKKDLKTWDGGEYDRIVAGSDQVWNLALTGGDSAYYLAFAAPPKRCAYAPSLGKDGAPRIEEPDARALREFRMLSAREESGAAFLRRLTGKDAERVCDPVLLVDAEKWRALACGRAPRKPYIFVYVIANQSAQMRAAIETLCARTGLRAYVFQPSHKRGAPGRYRHDYGPGEFLRMLTGARYVVTNSFHASAFSILFHKDFWTFVTPKNRVRDERLATLAEIYGLEERFVVPGAELPNLTARADFAAADAALAAERARAAAYLDRCLGADS